MPVFEDSPSISKNLNNHLCLGLVTTQKPGSGHRISYIDSPDALAEARKEWMIDRSGPLFGYYLPQMNAYFQSESIVGSQELRELDITIQMALQADTKPSYETISVSRTLVSLFPFPCQIIHTHPACRSSLCGISSRQ